MTERWRGKALDPTNRKAWFLIFLLLTLLVPSESFAAARVGLFWWESKAGNKPDAFSRKKPVNLALCRGNFPLARQGKNAVDGTVKLNSVKAWIKSPDGDVSKAALIQEEETVALDLPSRLNPAKLNGLYVIGAHVIMESVEIDSDGRNKDTHYYAKYLIYHQNEEGVQAGEQYAFFNDPDKIALEIGPVYTQDEKEETLWRERGCQEALKKYKLKVLYKGKPLADADVTFFAEGGWRKKAKTDANGLFAFVPLQSTRDHEKVERCLYTASTIDPLTGQYQCSSLMMYIKPPRSLYDSKARGFNYWAFLGAGLFLVCVITLIYRKKRRADKNLAEFESHKTKRD